MRIFLKKKSGENSCGGPHIAVAVMMAALPVVVAVVSTVMVTVVVARLVALAVALALALARENAVALVVLFYPKM